MSFLIDFLADGRVFARRRLRFSVNGDIGLSRKQYVKDVFLGVIRIVCLKARRRI